MSTVLKIADVVTADDHLPARARSSVKLPAKDDTLWKLVIGPFEDFYNHLVKNAMFRLRAMIRSAPSRPASRPKIWVTRASVEARKS